MKIRDGVFVQDIRFNQGYIDVGLSQPSRDSILEHVARRRNEQTLKKTDGVRLLLTIPLLDHQKLCRINPDLKSVNAETRRRAWEKFARSDESKPYRVT